MTRIAPFLVAAVVLAGSSVREPLRGTSAQGPSRGRVEEFAIPDKNAGAQRKVWIYTPPGYSASAAPYPAAYFFDGDDYVRDLGLPAALDRLIGDGTIPPLVAVMVDNSADRLGDLANHASFAAYMADLVVPWARKTVRITNDPHRTIVGGYSAGGLGAAYVAFKRPDVFGLVLSQSGAFWRGNEGGSDPFEWVAAQIAGSPKKDLRFYLEVGANETQRALGTGPVFIESTRRLRDALVRKGYDVEYVEVAGAVHNPEHWRAQLPAALAWTAGRLSR